MKPCVLIPVFNNEATVGQVVERARQAVGEDVLVVSDGSTDRSADQARRAGAEVIELPQNKGKGAAIRCGLEVAGERGFSHAVVLDADGQHLPEEIPGMLDTARAEPERIVIGVRQMDKAEVPPWSRRGRTISNFWTTVASWQRCRDAQSGFRVYPIPSTLALACRENRFQFEMEVLVRASWRGLLFAHHQVSVRYDTPIRVSHFDNRRDNWRFSWLSFRLFWGMLARLPLLAWRRATHPSPRARRWSR